RLLPIVRRATLLRGTLGYRCFSGLPDNLDDDIRMREHDHVTRIDLADLRAHSLRYETLKIGVHSLVLFSDDKRAGLRLPRRTDHFVVEEIVRRRIVNGPNDLLLLLGKVTGETTDAVWKYPDASIGYFNTFEYSGGRETLQLAVHGFIGVGRDSGDEN